ncbi:putative tryptophan dimethylallyltransferase [Aspergillus novofumigatus IBT 16806]|uniref:Putative tryptophan dimethylallyltransferase n=1 Tax=Aspergillus novofumigatus (strain IBT 16806) TaxID=1392255 RepID=A0A2I1BVB1_ASPN1|nr:putative tryptophan dimethylallyltransferase [Aspergillus novofumigatus IBT 16806]PKX89312.1 putative tryptophan dimethylallyltransferase [Aspergillus novofumigatus IBT 16806]
MTHEKPLASPSSSPLQMLSRTFNFASEDEAKWWANTAPMFAKMLIKANYDVHRQYRFLCLHREFVIPALGPYPQPGKPLRWKSMLTRFGLPFELSYNYSKSLVRFAFEPIGEHAGADNDPFNTKAIGKVLQGFGTILPGLNMEWYNRFAEELTISDDEAELARNTTVPFRTQSIIAADMDPNGDILLKAYFYPRIKSVVTGKSKEKLIFDTVRRVDYDGELEGPLSALQEFLASRGSGAGNAPIAHFCSCDLLRPPEARIKIYCYETELDYESLVSDWTLGGRRKEPQTAAGLELLRELWDLLRISEGHCDGPSGFHELGTSPEERLPFIVNFSLSPGNPLPVPQIYFPVFGLNDKSVANALEAFFQRVGWTNLAESYMLDLQEYYPDENLEATKHLQAWVSFSLKAGEPYISVYKYSYGAFEKHPGN